MPVQRFALPTLPRERWRNGAGWTRAVAQQGDGDGDGDGNGKCDGEGDGKARALLWRVSLAEIDRAAPFSRFDGLDRTTVLVRGGPVRLHSVERLWALAQPGDAAHYPGELSLGCDEPPATAWCWNVMARRGAMLAQVQVLPLHRPAEWRLPPHGQHLVWVMRGACTLTGPALLTPEHFAVDEGFSVADDSASLCLHSLTPDALLLHTRLLSARA